MKKYNKKDFLSYASAFDYTEDFHYNAEENGKPITRKQAIKENDKFMKSMNSWNLKDFHNHFGFSHFCSDSGSEKLIYESEES